MAKTHSGAEKMRRLEPTAQIWMTIDPFYQRQQEAQLPQRNSASAAHIEGLGPPAHSPSAPSGYTYAYGRIRKPQRTYVKRAVH